MRPRGSDLNSLATTRFTVISLCVVGLLALVIAGNLTGFWKQLAYNSDPISTPGPEWETVAEVVEVLGQPVFAASSMNPDSLGHGYQFRIVERANEETVSAVLLFSDDDYVQELAREYFEEMLPAGDGYQSAWISSPSDLTVVHVDAFGLVEKVEILSGVKLIQLYDWIE